MKNFSTSVTILFVLILNMSSLTQGQNWKNEISSNYFYIKAADSDKFWDLPGTHPNTAKRDLQFQIWDNDYDKYERSFTFPGIRNTEYFCIRNLTGYIVDVAGKQDLSIKEKLQKKTGKKFKMKKDNGVEIQTWDMGKDGVAQWQQWRIIIVDRHTIMFENIFTGKAIDMQGGGDNIKKNGTKLISYERNNSSAQRFQLVYADGPRKGQLLDFEK